MLNPFQTINWSPERRKIRSSAIVFAAGFLLIAGGFFGAGLWGIIAAGVVALCALLIGGTAMLFPDSFGLWFYRIWFALGAAIGLVVGNLLFGVLFFLVFTPFALGMRLMTRRDPLRLRCDETEQSGWRKVEQVEDAGEYFHQY